MKEFFKTNYLLFVKIILTIYSLYSLKYLFKLKHIESEFYMNITFIFIIAAVYLLINYTINILKHGIDKRLLVISLFMGLYFSYIALLGAYYEGATKGVRYKEVLDFTVNNFKQSLVYIPALWFLFLGGILFIYVQIPKIYNNYTKQYDNKIEMPKMFNKLYKIWIFIFICWLPYFVLLYPGYVSPDAIYQINLLASGEFNAHHPILTALYMYFIPIYYKLSDNGVVTIALYVLFFQMIPLSFVYAYVINRLNSIYMINKNITIFLILFVALYPANPITSITIDKGLLFIIFLLLFLVKVIELVEQKEIIKSTKHIIQLIIFGTALALTRNNVIYGLFLILPVMLLFAQNYRKYIFILFSGILICFLLVNSIMIKITDARIGQFRESMSMPIQQIARVYKYHKNTLNEEETKIIENMMKNKKALNDYRPKLSDPVKNATDSNFLKTKEFVTCYIKLGLKYPGTYLNSFLIMSSPILDLFNNQFFIIGLYTYIDTRKNLLTIKNEDLKKYKNQVFSSYLFKSQRSVNKNNSMAMFVLINQSLLFYLFLFTFIYFVYKGMYKYNFILLIPLGYTVTILLGPIIYIRYTYYLAAIIPIIVMMLTNRNNSEMISKTSEK